MPDFSTSTATALSIAQSLLIAERTKGPVTAALINQKMAIAASVVAPGNEDSIDQASAVAELIRRFSLWIGQDTALSDTTGHEIWLNAARKKDWRYWPRYRDMLERRMSTTAVDAVDKSTDRILGLMEDPSREGAWDRRGLVVGHVQSGKTANYSGLICKAADSGYKIIIILAGCTTTCARRRRSALKRASWVMKRRQRATSSSSSVSACTAAILRSSQTARRIGPTQEISIPKLPSTWPSRQSNALGSLS